MSEFTITEEEKQLILEHRRRKEGQKRCTKPVHNSINPNEGPNVGRLPPGHPLNWFEKDIFTKIGNVKHRSEHAKIRKCGMKIQSDNRDRVYHVLTHMDVLWTNPTWDAEKKMSPSESGPHPLMTEEVKILYEKFKKKYNIGDDNINPLHKAVGEEEDRVKYPIFKNKRPFSQRVQEEVDAYQPKPNDGI